MKRAALGCPVKKTYIGVKPDVRSETPAMSMPVPDPLPVVRLARALAIVMPSLALALTTALPTLAAEQGISWSKAGSDAFHDLPGVRPQSPDPLDDGYACDTATVAPGGHNARDLRDRLPYTVYRCEKDGVVYQGTQPPTRGRMWYPGVNPRNID